QAWNDFYDALYQVCLSLARQVARDGEGATKMFGVQVIGAADREDAREVARAVASSYLVKTAVYASDANWGRVIVAAGKTNARMDTSQASLWLVTDSDELPLFIQGEPV